MKKFLLDFISKHNDLTEKELTNLFYEENRDKLVRTRDTHISEDFPEALGYDGYDFMEIASNKGWKVTASMGDWPYVQYLYNEDTLLSYCEGDLTYYKLK